MKNRFLFGCFSSLSIVAGALAIEGYSTRTQQAEALVAEGSYAKAHELYAEAMEMSNITSNEAQWIQFRFADTQWRSAAATQTADNTRLEKGRTALERMVRDAQREEEHDRVWAEVEESLGDFWWTRRNQQNWGQAWPYYERALNWWAGQSDIDLARERYLSIVWRCARPATAVPHYRYGYYGNYLPLQILENALKIAQSDEDKAHAHYLIATTLQQQGGSWDQQARIPEEFEAAITLGSKTDWYDDALFNYAQWMAQRGHFIPMENGGFRTEPDYVKALELFQRLVREFDKGETRYWDQAQRQIKTITDAQVSVSVANIFLPGSEIQYQLNWRNVKQVELALYPVDLTRDVDLGDPDSGRRRDWLNSIELAGREPSKTWNFNTEDKGDHVPGNKSLQLDESLKPGAYVLEATAGGEKGRDLILVSDAAVVLKTSGKQALVYVCDALKGAPLTNSEVTLWARWHDGNRWQKTKAEKQTDPDGIAVFDLPEESRNLESFIGARHESRQAFATANTWWGRRNADAWKIYAFTDRPAYRPKETANWKFTARRYNGSVYSTPTDAVVEYEIADPRGAKVSEGKATLNTFGSAWGSLELTEQMPLGEYRITFWDEGRKNPIGNATLFRLEEYKLPEFKVSVSTPEENSESGVVRKKAFRLGDTVEATIQADYYFGGPVANADVEVVIYQNPFWIAWPQPRDFPWFYEDMDEGRQPWRRGWGGNGPIIKRETLKTDATGKVTVSFETPANDSQDYEYRIEARVTDSSRREIVGNGTVRVTRQRYYVNARPQHNLYRPQDKVTVEFQAQDANSNPVSIEGNVKVTRQYWWEIWLKPDGTEVKGDDLKRLQAQHPLWPPAPERPDQKGWRLKFRGYEQEDVLTQTVKTDTNGVAELSFTPEREGYYRVDWTSEDKVAQASGLPQVQAGRLRYVKADTTVWVADNKSTDIGYRHGGVEIIADKDTFRVGNEATVMLVANAPDRYVLFSVEGEDLQSYRLVHLAGSVKLINLLIEEQHVPNIFLGATMVSDRQIFTDTKQVVVPPTKNFLTVDVQSDREQYQPRDEGTLTVTTRNDEGKPVSAEVSLSLVDESVFYIQSDYAGDPRQFFFGDKRLHQVQTQSTMNQKRYAKLVEFEGGGLMDEKDVETASRNEEERLDLYYAKDKLGRAGGMGGGGTPLSDVRFEMDASAGVPMQTAAPAAMPMMARGAVAETRGLNQLGPALLEPTGEEPNANVMVRSDFRSTILWLPDVKTDADGTAAVKVQYPDSVTSWKATARAATSGNQFGIGDTTTRTKQPLIVRLQAPRFFVVGDTATISAVINNNTEKELRVGCSFNLNSAKGLVVENRETDKAGVYGTFETIVANGEARVDLLIHVKAAGTNTIRVFASAGELSDAIEKSYVAYEHGIEKFISKSGKVRGDDITVKLDIPKERKPESTTLTVQVTPSMAVTMLDALPYLIDYPYGCTEQTMSRFLPAVITAKTLKDLGLQPEDVMGRVFGGIEQRAADVSSADQNRTSGGTPEARSQKDLSKLDDMTQAGLDRLYDFQHGDGGWGWWKEGESDHWMTAYVVWGLTLAKQAGVEVRPEVIRRGADFLNKSLVEEENSPDMQAWMLHALAVQKAAEKESGLSEFQQKAFENLWAKRDQLNAYTRALFALAAHDFGKTKEAKTLVANLENGVIRDDRPDTSVLVRGSGNTQNADIMGAAHWGNDGIYWRWSDGGVEATAFALRALLTIDPDNELIEPVTNWLIKNRRGAQWSNTRDTAIVVLAMNDYLRASGELNADLEFEVLVNGKSVAKRKVSGAEVFSAPSRFEVDRELIKDGVNEIRIKRKGEGAVYFAAEARFFSLEEPIPAAGNEIFVKRQYFKLVGRPTLLKGYVYDRVRLLDGESVESGERVETVITIDAKNNYEYLLFEDLKPAGFEAVEVRSGESLYARELKASGVERRYGSATPIAPQAVEYTVRSGDTLSQIAQRYGTTWQAIQQANNLDSTLIKVGQKLKFSAKRVIEENSDFTGRSRWVYQELRDRKVALFIDKLPEGVWELSYNFRAEVPGKFHALPVLGHAMYVPEIRCNGDELRVTVLDKE